MANSFTTLSALLYLLFLIWMCYDCIKYSQNRFFWLAVILLFQPLGPLFYFLNSKLLAGFKDEGSFKRKVFLKKDFFSDNSELNSTRELYEQYSSIENTINYAEELIRNAKINQAKEILLKQLLAYPNNPYLLLGLANCEFKLQNFKIAIEHLLKITDEKPDFKNYEALYALASAYRFDGQKEKMKETFNHLVLRSPDPEYQIKYAEAAFEVKDIEKTREILNDIIVNYNKSSDYVKKYQKKIYETALRMTKKLPTNT